MDRPIMLTPHDLFNIFLAICGAIITVSAAVAVIAKLIDKAKAPEKGQNERIENLEREVKSIKERLTQGNKRFEVDAEKVAALERSMKQSNKVIIESLQALTAHAIDGNQVQELKASKRRLDEYLLEKI